VPKKELEGNYIVLLCMTSCNYISKLDCHFNVVILEDINIDGLSRTSSSTCWGQQEEMHRNFVAF
jgi:hypothetical protein